jgi:hypothetical protein
VAATARRREHAGIFQPCGSIRPPSGPAQAELGRGTLVSSNDCDGPGHPPDRFHLSEVVDTVVEESRSVWHHEIFRMAKRRQEERPPVELPLARLFLDDLEELARIFVDARTKWGDPPPEGEEATGVTFQVDEWECDTIQDLKELGRYRKYFEMRSD